MTAICGKLSSKKVVTETEIHNSLDNMSFRGGPLHNLYVFNNFGIGIGQRVLGSEGGLFHSEDRKTWVALDGEIFNINKIIRAHKLQLEVNLNVFIWLYKYYEESFISKLEGNFSIVIYDGIKEKVILARDHIGTKPLFYYVKSGEVFFLQRLLDY